MQQHTTSRSALTLASLGVVYGDIGTSPLYAVKETFSPSHGIAVTPANVTGGISAIFWTLLVVVSLKYVVLVMRADNRGEGGTMALLSLATSALGERRALRRLVVVLGAIGASLFYGESVLTPAISVVSAVEGLAVGSPLLRELILPAAAGVLLALFWIQRRGSARIGRLFGPICLAWFVALGVVGLWNVLEQPAVLAGLDPRHALAFVSSHGIGSFLVLGAVLLAFTGAEALYADMGHFGKGPIRTAWFAVVLPGLALNYFGQGALLIARPDAAPNPFYLAFPHWALYPMVALATAASVIASQATLTGAYSLTRQAIQLGFLPRMQVIQTSARAYGAIYVPAVNWILLVLVLAAVFGFGDSSSLASAYGISVTGTMTITTLLTFFVMRYHWRYPLVMCLLPTGVFLVIDAAFFSSAMMKLLLGGWFPLSLGALMAIAMLTWRRGRALMLQQTVGESIPLQEFLDTLFRDPPPRITGTAVFLTAAPATTPRSLLHNLKHNKVLHEQVIFLTIEIADVPWIPFTERLSVAKLGHGCWSVAVRFGFKNPPDVPQALELARDHGLALDMMTTSFFASRSKIVPSAAVRGMALWRERLFAAMARNAGSATDYFNIPSNRVIELGTRVEI